MPADSPENKCPDPVINLDSDLRPVSVSIPCPATVEAVLGLPEPVTLPCGKLDGHDGEHEYWIGWTDCACSDCRGRGEIEGYEFNPFYSEHSGPVVDKCSACGGSGRINTSGPDDSKIENKYQGSPSVPDREGECPDCEGESIEGRGCRTCNSTGRVVSPSPDRETGGEEIVRAFHALEGTVEYFRKLTGDLKQEIVRQKASVAAVVELALMLGWALDYIHDVGEVPLADEEPDLRAKFDRAGAALRVFNASREEADAR